MSPLGPSYRLPDAPDFRKLLAVRLSSQLADGLVQAALAALIFFSPDRAASLPAAAAAIFLTVGPYTLVGSFLGVFLDRWPRRRVLALVPLGRAILSLGTAGMLFTSSDDGFGMLTLALLSISLNRLFLTALGTSLPAVLPPRQLVLANSYIPTAGTIVALVGAAIGYVMQRFLPAAVAAPEIVLILAAGMYLMAGFFALRIAKDRLGPQLHLLPARQPRPQLGAVAVDLRAGYRLIGASSTAKMALATVALTRIGLTCTGLSMLLIGRNLLSSSTDSLAGLDAAGTIAAATGLGFAVSALSAPRLLRKLSIAQVSVICLLLTAVAQGVFAFPPTQPRIILVAFILGWSAQTLKIGADTSLQIFGGDEFRGRVFSWYDVIFSLAVISGALLAVLTVPDSGFAPATSLALCLSYSLAAASCWLHHRRSSAVAAASDCGPDSIRTESK